MRSEVLYLSTTMSRKQYDTLVAAVNWVLDDADNDTRMVEELEDCLRLLHNAKVEAEYKQLA